MTNKKLDTSFAITGYNGIFPDAENPEKFWQKILLSKPAPLTSLEKRWDMPREFYYNGSPGTPDKIYLDKAFCIEEKDIDLNNYQVNFGEKIVKELFKNIEKEHPLPDLERTGLVIAATGTDAGYYTLDEDILFNKKNIDLNYKGNINSISDQLKRIAESAGLGGPRMSVDTACASSIYGIDLAMKIINTGQARSMVVLGVNLALTYALQAALSQLMIISPEGRIVPFDNNASGIIVGETAAAVLIEPIENAINEKRNIYGVIKSIGLSSDGSGGSVFAPCKEAQVKSYERTYKNIDPSTIDYIETHGTATQTGDDIEITTLDSFFRNHVDSDKKIPIGSVKAVVGHTLAAAGMCALIKSLLMIKNKTIPPHIVEEKHSKIAESCIDVPQSAGPFSDMGRPVRIAISNFGLGGSNAHMVIESFEEKYYKKINKKKVINYTELAIIDFETTMGRFSEISEWEKQVRSGDKSLDNFPKERFPIELNDRHEGFFFPRDIEIEAMGLRMGPKLITRVDPLQNLATHQINKLLLRNPDFKNSDDTGIVMCNNLGGGKTVSLSRKHFLRKKGITIEENPGLGETTLEDITSSMANMFSGFPAFHFNLTGFHVTHSGGTSTFLTSLISASEWLKDNCKVLLLGAGYYISSPVQLLSNSLNKINKPLLECVGTFAFKTLKNAESNNDRILAVVKNIIDCEEKSTFEDVCADTDYKLEDIDIREKINLTSGFDKEDDQAYYLSEATGIDALTSLILKEGKIGTIEIYKDKKLLFVFFIEKRNDYEIEEFKIKLPTKIFFSDKTLGEPGVRKKENKIEKPDIVNLDNVIFAKNDFIKWHDNTSKGISLYLQMQTKLLSLLDQNSFKQDNKGNVPGKEIILDVAGLRNNPENIVVSPVKKIGNSFVAELIVDETHPYFFDHPLDHVPGILITEGLLQLVEVAIKHLNLDNNNFFVNFCDLSFNKWCEKRSPITIILKLIEEKKQDELKFGIEFKQNNAAVCKTSIVASVVGNNRKNKNEATKNNVTKLERKELVHKKRNENVLISDFYFSNIDNKKYFSVDVISPGAEHILKDGDESYKSLIFFMEIARQCLNLYAHTQQEVQLDNIIMTQLGNTIELNRPINFKEKISLIHYKSEKQKVDNTYFSQDEVVALDIDGKEIGKCTVLAQVQQINEYQNDRYRENV